MLSVFFSVCRLFAQTTQILHIHDLDMESLADRSFGAGRAMGGIGYGLRSSKQINPLNPASYTSIDSMMLILILELLPNYHGLMMDRINK